MKIQTTKIFSIINSAKSKGFSTISAQGASRSGKTRNIVIWLVIKCLKRKKLSVSVVRSNLPSIRRSVWRDFKEVMMQLDVWDERWLNKKEFMYTFPNGSYIEFFGSDSEQKLRGPKRNILYVNEANELRYIAFQQLQMRTTEFTICDYNPSFSDDHWICGLNAEESTFHFITTYKDNPFLEEKVVKEIESLQWKNKSLWQIYGLGKQAIAEGLIFENTEQINEFPDCKHVFIGIDYGFTNDPTAIVMVGIRGDDLFVDEIVYNTEMLTSDIIKTLRPYKDYKIISESADPRLIQEIHRANYNIHPVRKYSGSIDAGINKMKEYRIHITKSSINIIKEFKNYTYAQNKDGKFINQPIDAFNHSIDAIRYVILNEVLGGIKKPIDIKKIRKIVY